MALYINKIYGKEVRYVGQKTYLTEIDTIKSIQADGHELAWILENISGIPLPLNPKRTVRWYGDHAKFIVSNFAG